MRIVLLTTNLARGGAEAQVAQIAIHLRQRGHDVWVVSLITPSAWRDELTAAGVPVIAAGAARVPLVLNTLRPQILHCHMFHANVFGRIVRMICPVPVVISTVHSIAETSRSSRSIRWRDLAYRVSDRLADATVAVSRAVAERHVAANAVAQGRVRVIPNGVDTTRFHPGGAARSGPFVWLAVGRLMWKKDYPTLLDAFARLSGGVLRIAGTGPDERTLRETAPPNVEFLGHREDIAELMRRADAFVMSSVIEGFPMVLLEAAASGLPCVATDAGGVRELGTVAIVPPHDPRALAGAMQCIMDMSPEERRRIGHSGRAQVEAMFSLDAAISQWEKLYAELWT